MQVTPRHRLTAPRQRTAIAGLILALVGCVALAGAIALLRPTASTDMSTPTIWRTITAGLTGEYVPPRVALEAFAYRFQVQVPGVTVPKGREGGDAPNSGTAVLSWVRRDWASFTAQQQAAIQPFLQPGPNDTVIHLDLTASGGTAVAAVAHGEAPAAVLAVNNSVFDAFASELAADLKHLGPKLGLPIVAPSFPGYDFPGLSDVTLVMSDQDGGNTKYATNSMDLYGHGFTPCNVTVYRNAWQNEHPVGNVEVSSTVHVDLMHEAVHCYQNEVWGSTAIAIAMPDWITEGTAEWLAGDDTDIVQENLPSAWRDGWFFAPDQALTTRTYDAVGYFALLAHLGRDLWSLMVPAWQAAKASVGNHSDPFIAVLNGDADDVRHVWAESLLQRADWSDTWVTHGFGLPANARVTSLRIPANSTPITGTIESRANRIAIVDGSDGEIVDVQTSGLVSAHDEAAHEVLATTSATFCTVASCVCPPGTLRAGEDLASRHMDLPFQLAFNAPEGGSAYVITDVRLSDACAGAPMPSPVASGPGTGAGEPPGGGSGPLTPDCGATGCAGDNGDPHLTTVDGQHYDFQAAGEFVLLRSADGSIEIQGRQEPFRNSTSVAINTAVAMRVGSHRVMIEAAEERLVVHVDGRTVDPGDLPLDLGSGGRIVALRTGDEVDLPDGTRAWAISVGRYGINLQIRPSDTLRASGTGILARLVDRRTGLPALPDGTSLPVVQDPHGSWQRLYQTFADAWRVTASTSLFDYAPGTSTATYTKPGFPAEGGPMSFADLSPAAQADGLRQCASIADPELQQECAYDVSVTGEPGFGDLYIATQRADRGTGPAPTPTPPTTPSPEPVGPVSPGSMVAPGIPQLLDGADEITGAAIGPDDSLYVSLLLADASSQVIATGPRGLRVTARATIPGADAITVAAGSTWVGERLPDGTCAIARLDPTTLATQATVPVSCLFGAPMFAAHDAAIWFVDTTRMDVDLHGAVLRRIDPATNRATDPAIPMPSANGNLRASADNTALILETNDEVLFLAAGASEFQSLGKLQGRVVAADRGAWNWTSDTDTATLVGPSGPITILAERWSVIGADDRAVYADGGPGSPATSTLWRSPADGSPGQQIATGATVPDSGGTVDLGYFDNWPFLVGSHAAVKLWLPFSPNGNGRALDIQWTPLP